MVPADWRDADVVPLFKKGDKTKAVNYRPVSLTSISCKLLEHIIHSNVMGHLDRFRFLNNSQHGFRQKRSCETQLITTTSDFVDCLNRKGQIDAILLDFSKAFDKVDHEGLLLKLQHIGLYSSLLLWFRSFLIGRNQRVLVEGTASASKPVLSGVPQGTVLGPLLFLVYINDISVGLSEGTEIHLFADDSLLYRRIDSIEDSITLQKDLDQLQKWELMWKMEFHPQKCQLLRITNKHSPIQHTYNIHNIALEESKSAKYLGVTIDNTLSWKEHYTATAKKANKVLAFLRRNLYNCPENIKEKCFKTFVRPILEYGSVVWDPHFKIDIEKLELIQKRAGRFVTGNYCMEHGNTEINMKKLNWDTLEERRAKIKVNMLYKAKMGLVDIPFELQTIRSARHEGSYAIPASTIDSHLYSFYSNSIRLWNLLPANIKS